MLCKKTQPLPLAFHLFLLLYGFNKRMVLINIPAFSDFVRLNPSMTLFDY